MNFFQQLFLNMCRFALYTIYPGDVSEPSSSVDFHVNERINRVSYEYCMGSILSQVRIFKLAYVHI